MDDEIPAEIHFNTKIRPCRQKPASSIAAAECIFCLLFIEKGGVHVKGIRRARRLCEKAMTVPRGRVFWPASGFCGRVRTKASLSDRDMEAVQAAAMIFRTKNILAVSEFTTDK